MTTKYNIQVLLFILSVIFLCSCHRAKQLSGAAGKQASYIKPTSKELKKKYAKILETRPRKIKHKELYYFIDEWYGVSYKWGGNDKKGVDCSGFVTQLYTTVYGEKIKRTVASQYASTKNFKRKRRLREGNLIYFTETNNPSHVGVYLMNGFFVHSASGKGVHISHINNIYWKKTYTGGGKVKKRS